jgi:monooxygenase
MVRHPTRLELTLPDNPSAARCSPSQDSAAQVEHLDVLVLGAGISGIGAAHYLQTMQPDKSFAILEARGSLGGTWDLFRYPGIRSDSDLYTFGYEFKPWKDESSIAGADKILAYLRETAAEHHLEEKIRLRHKVTSASWSGEDALWTVTAEHDGAPVTFTCRWIFSATGYYDYEQGYTPRFEGLERFGGQVVHPQHWPDELDYTGKRVVVIGSGATAVTLAPAMASGAAHVTVLQRTPTFILPVPAIDALAVRLQRLLGEDRAHPLVRRKSIATQRLIWRLCQRFPRQARGLIRRINEKQLPDGYPVDVHFNPPYDPWDQRLCVVPDGDLFRSIREGSVTMVTDRVARFTETAIELESGEVLEADLVVTATGLNLLPFGGIDLEVDGAPVDLSDTVSYKGMMLSGVPNYAYAIGYTNASWTLKVGLLCEQFCRLLAHMDAHGCDTCVPVLEDPDMELRPLLDFGAGYVQRSIGSLPKQGADAPWLTSMSYHDDVKLLRKAPVVDPWLHFGRASGSTAPVGAATRRSSVGAA